MKPFRLCTLFNKPSVYEAMRRSFADAGFHEGEVEYEALDNSASNVHEPFSAFNAVLERSKEGIIIFCHQDVLLDQGHTLEHLKQALADLTARDPNWAVAGTAGVSATYQFAKSLTDPRGGPVQCPYPQRVVSLDENFIVINRESGVRFSADLSGYHFYGPDISLNALLRKRSCYVIDFRMTHLSAGTLDEEFHAKRREFQKRWSPAFRFWHYPTTCTKVILSRYPWARGSFEWASEASRGLRAALRQGW